MGRCRIEDPMVLSAIEDPLGLVYENSPLPIYCYKIEDLMVRVDPSGPVKNRGPPCSCLEYRILLDLDIIEDPHGS